MKKKTIAAGALLLAMACGQGPSEQRAQLADEPVQEMAPATPAASPGSPASGGAEDETDSFTLHATADQGGNTSSDVAVKVLDANAAGWASGEKKKPEVGNAFSSNAAVTGTDTSHRFIRTADLAFRVKDVVHATLGIEDIVKAHGGWIASTRLRSEPRGTRTIPVSEDSLLEVSRYELMNSVSLRLPDEELDVALREIGAWVDLFDHRDISADDIKLRMTANALTERRAKAHSQRLGQAIDDHGRRLRETVSAEEALLASDEKRDQSILSNMELADRVAYSTVSLTIHQPALIREEMKASEHALSAYQPSLGTRLGDALADGWRLVEILITGLLSIWPVLVLLGGSLWLFWRKRRTLGRELPPMVVPQA